MATAVATNLASFRAVTTSETAVGGRRRGGIRRHGPGWQVRVSAGTDPSTGERIVLYETVPIAEAPTKSARERAEREAYKEAQKVLTRLQAEADSLKVARTRATVGALLDRWMAQHETDPTTRMTYEAQIRLYIVPNLGDMSSPRDPASLTRRYGRLVAKLGVDTVLKELRHYSATELLTAGVDLRTVAGRLGHGDGTTTMRHYAAWVGSADTAAAGVIGGRMPTLRPVEPA